MSDSEDNDLDCFDDQYSEIFDKFEYNVEDIAAGNHFDHLKSEDSCSTESLTVLRRTRVEEIMKIETDYESELRASMSKMSPYMLNKQESDLRMAFSEVNFLRAELAELVPNTDIPLLRKGILAKYVTANRKELQARRSYADLVKASATQDAKLGVSCEEWVLRVETDIAMVRETKRVQLENKNTADVVLRKKHDYDHNRARAVLRADLSALSTAWPSGSYAHLVA